MELIDRRKLLKHLSDWWLSETPSGNREILFINGVPQKTPTMKVIEECIKAVEDQPTAYDIDKVVEQLEEKMIIAGSYAFEHDMSLLSGNLVDEIAYGRLKGYQDAIEIVKGGVRC